MQRVFGGQVLGQALVAAARTVEGRVCHSLHAYFLRAGDPKTFPSFTKSTAPATAPASRRGALSPSSTAGRFSISRLVSDRRRKASNISSTCLRFPRRKRWRRTHLRLRDHRQIAGRGARMVAAAAPDRNPSRRAAQLLRSRKIRAADQTVWISATGPVPDDLIAASGVLAYASDMSAARYRASAARRRAGIRRMQMASLDHAMWFHRRFRVDDWLLYAQESPSASGARGFNRGAIYARDGILVASVVQEGLMRPRPPASA